MSNFPQKNLFEGIGLNMKKRQSEMTLNEKNALNYHAGLPGKRSYNDLA